MKNYNNFTNKYATAKKSIWTFLKMRFTEKYAKWPSWVHSEYGPKPTARIDGEEVHITVINHATVLIQTRGYNIITDPIYGARCSPFSFLGPKRVRNPGVRFEDLPKIDIIAISHDHYDHLDLPTMEMLIKRDNPKIFTGIGVGGRLDSNADVTELEWWESHKVSDKLSISFTQVQHFSGRTLSDYNSTLWGGFVFDLDGHKIYFGGDSGYNDHYNETFEKFGPMDIALLPIGAYAPKEFMRPVHMDPKEAIQAHKDLRARKSIGIHYGTFQLTAEDINEPVELLKKELKKAGISEEDFLTPEFGHAVIL